MCQLVTKDPSHLWRNRLDARNRHTNFPVIQRGGPRRRLSYVKESLVSIERDKDIFWRSSKIIFQIAIIVFQQVQYLLAQCVGCLRAFITQSEMAAFLLAEVGFGL